LIYKATFKGRAKGALGISYMITTQVEAPDKETAALKLYARYEHISGLVLV